MMMKTKIDIIYDLGTTLYEDEVEEVCKAMQVYSDQQLDQVKEWIDKHEFGVEHRNEMLSVVTRLDIIQFIEQLKQNT